MKKSQSLELTPAETLVSKAMPLLKEAVSVVPDLMHALLGLEKKLQRQNRRLAYIARYYPDVHQDALENAGKEDF
ncbi:MAG: hypothetical protein EOM68_14120 [Spirochaetia bacterium]|nr:hypothetical protein [Spirochaetia bacterium]